MTEQEAMEFVKRNLYPIRNNIIKLNDENSRYQIESKETTTQHKFQDIIDRQWVKAYKEYISTHQQQHIKAQELNDISDDNKSQFEEQQETSSSQDQLSQDELGNDFEDGN